MTTKTPTLLGGAMIIAGTIIGAGMLANPTATSGVWFIGSVGKDFAVHAGRNVAFHNVAPAFWSN